MTMTIQHIADNLRSFELHGINFLDIESITEDGEQWEFLIDTMYSRFKDEPIDMLVALDARGFLIAGALQARFGKQVGMKMVRKAGKLPGQVQQVSYGVEYRSENTAEIQDMGALEGKRVLIVDDVLATGGTAAAAVKLVERVGGIVAGLVFAIEIPVLEGRSKLMDYVVTSELSVIDDHVFANVEYCVDMLARDTTSGELMLIERLNDPLGIAMPGGRIEHESAREAAERELTEETGCTVLSVDYHSTLAGIDRDPRGIKVSLVMECRVLSQAASSESGKTTVVKVPSPEHLPPPEAFAFDHGSHVHESWPAMLVA